LGASRTHGIGVSIANHRLVTLTHLHAFSGELEFFFLFGLLFATHVALLLFVVHGSKALVVSAVLSFSLSQNTLERLFDVFSCPVNNAEVVFFALRSRFHLQEVLCDVVPIA